MASYFLFSYILEAELDYNGKMKLPFYEKENTTAHSMLLNFMGCVVSCNGFSIRYDFILNKN